VPDDQSQVRSTRSRQSFTADLPSLNSATHGSDSGISTDLVAEKETPAVEIDASAPTRFVRLNISEE